MGWLQQSDGTVIIALKVTPGARHDKICMPVRDAAGDSYIPVKITAVAEKGQANKRVIALLAKTFKLAKSDFTLKSGLTSRKKKILIKDQANQVYEMLLNWAK